MTAVLLLNSYGNPYKMNIPFDKTRAPFKPLLGYTCKTDYLLRRTKIQRVIPVVNIYCKSINHCMCSCKGTGIILIFFLMHTSRGKTHRSVLVRSNKEQQMVCVCNITCVYLKETQCSRKLVAHNSFKPTAANRETWNNIGRI